MCDRFRGLIQLQPVASTWLQMCLLPLAGFTGGLLLQADIGLQPRVGLLLMLVLWLGYEWHHIARQPQFVCRAPDGSWFGLWRPPESLRKPLFTRAFGFYDHLRVHAPAGRPLASSKNLALERHFLFGTWSITLLVRDSEGRSYRLWCLKTACPDPQWRRLIVLLRWPDATKGQGNC